MLGVRTGREGFAHRAAAQDAMKMHGSKSPCHSPCRGSLGGHICSHCAFQPPLASCSSLSHTACLLRVWDVLLHAQIASCLYLEAALVTGLG